MTFYFENQRTPVGWLVNGYEFIFAIFQQSQCFMGGSKIWGNIFIGDLYGIDDLVLDACF